MTYAYGISNSNNSSNSNIQKMYGDNDISDRKIDHVTYAHITSLNFVNELKPKKPF